MKKPNQKLPAAQSPMSNAQRVLKWWQDMEGGLMTWKTTWQQIGDYFCPRKSSINVTRTEGSATELVDLFNTTGIEAGQIHASGTFDALFSGRFFRFTPFNSRDASSPAKQWMEKATEITLDRLHASNFFLEAHECIQDDTYFGTGNLLCEMVEGQLVFFNDRVGSYGISEGRNGIVDTVIRKYELTVHQAVDEFGYEKCGKEIRKEWDTGDMDKRAKKFSFVQAIYPRPKSEINLKAIDGTQYPIASCHVDMTAKKECRSGGYEEMPCAVTRYLKWNKDPYGWSPAMLALPTVRQLNFIERSMDAIANVKAEPRILLPTSMDGNDVDFRAKGITFFDEANPALAPRVWMHEGEYDIGLERIDKKNELVKRLFHVDMWQMLAQVEREMTAYEVASRKAEKTSAISPSFFRKQPEFFNIILPRVFGLLLRQGEFGPAGEIPQELLIADGKGVRLAAPRIVLTGKLAMAIKEAENNAFLQWSQMVAPLAELVGPVVFDPVDLVKASAGISENLGVTVGWQRSDADMRKMAADRAQQAQQAQALAGAEMATKSAANLGKAPQGIQKALTGGGR